MWYLLSHCLSTRAHPQQVANCLQAGAALSFRFCSAPTVFSDQLITALTENVSKLRSHFQTDLQYFNFEISWCGVFSDICNINLTI